MLIAQSPMQILTPDTLTAIPSLLFDQIISAESCFQYLIKGFKYSCAIAHVLCQIISLD